MPKAPVDEGSERFRTKGASIALDQQQRRLARAGFAVFLLVGGVQALYGPTLPSIRASFGLSAATVGWTIAAHYTGAVTGVLLSLFQEGRLQPRTRLAAGLVSVAIGAISFGLIRAWPLALIGVFGIGLGYGILVVVVNEQFAEGFGIRSGPLVILVNAGFGLGAVIGPLLFGIFAGADFRPAFLAAGSLAALLLPLSWAVPVVAKHQPPPPAPSSNPASVALAGFVALFFLYTALETNTSGWMATHLVFRGYSQPSAAELTAGFWVALTVGRLLSVPLSLVLSPLRMIAGALSGVLILTLAAGLSDLTAVAYVLIGLLLAPIFPVSFAWMARALPGARGKAPLALLGALGGGLVFPVLVGRIMGATTPNALPWVLAAIALACVMLSLSLPKLVKAARSPQI